MIGNKIIKFFIRKKEEGTSLVEFVVSMSMFVTILMSATSIYFTYSVGSRKSFASQNVIDEGRFLLDTISKELRTGRGFNFNNTTQEISFTAADGSDIKYQLENEKIKKGTNNGTLFPVTSDQVKVEKLELAIIKPTGGVNEIPRIIITIRISNNSVSTKQELDSSIDLQTTISPRN